MNELLSGSMRKTDLDEVKFGGLCRCIEVVEELSAIRLRVASLLEGICEPLKTFVKTITSSSASGLDVPGTLSEGVKAELVSNLSGVHGIGQILLVGKDEKKSVTEFVLIEHALQLLTGLNYTVAIVAIDDEDDTLGVLEVMSPQRTDLVLSSDIPNRELDVLVLDGLDVEADSGDRGHDFTQFELVKNGGLSGCVETNHQDAHLLLAPQSVKQLRERETHVCGVVAIVDGR